MFPVQYTFVQSLHYGEIVTWTKYLELLDIVNTCSGILYHVLPSSALVIKASP